MSLELSKRVIAFKSCEDKNFDSCWTLIDNAGDNLTFIFNCTDVNETFTCKTTVKLDQDFTTFFLG